MAQQAQPAASDYGISSEQQLDLGDAETKVWFGRLNDIELNLTKEDIPAGTQRRALRDVNKINEGAKVRLQQEQTRLKPIRRELESLEPAPAEGGLPESEDIANLRFEINGRIAEVEARLREIQLVLVRTENLELALISREEGPSVDRLWVRLTILWKVETWRITGAGLLTLARAVTEAPVGTPRVAQVTRVV